jgi:hypothetical protein
MGKKGDGYGSEDHFLTYRETPSGDLDARLLAATGLRGELSWHYPDLKAPDMKEPKGINFLSDQAIREAWKAFWPQTGNQQRWDGVARVGDEWLLMEAKANAPEFVGAPCGASFEKPAEGERSSRQMIEKALNEVKAALGVHRHFNWLGSYYQFANRLATLHFLLKHNVEARLVFVHFCGDRFPDDRACPASQHEWQRLIEARRVTLGLPEQHELLNRVHEVFLPVGAKSGV